MTDTTAVWQAGQLAEKLARKRDAEVARREEFVRVQSMYIHREVLQAMGLFENPSQCIVNISPYDTNLLDIDIMDVERYAPESLVGRLTRGPDQKPRGGSRSLSNSGYQSSGVGSASAMCGGIVVCGCACGMGCGRDACGVRVCRARARDENAAAGGCAVGML